MPPAVGAVTDATSTASNMPDGGVQVAAEVKLWAVTSRSPAWVVVTLGAEWVRPFTVGWPSSTSIGVHVLTPLNAAMPPAAPVGEPPSVQLKSAPSVPSTKR